MANWSSEQGKKLQHMKDKAPNVWSSENGEPSAPLVEKSRDFGLAPVRLGVCKPTYGPNLYLFYLICQNSSS